MKEAVKIFSTKNEKSKTKNEVKNKRKCDKCGNAEKTYGMICMDGVNMENRSICLNCGAGMPAPFNLC